VDSYRTGAALLAALVASILSACGGGGAATDRSALSAPLAAAGNAPASQGAGSPDPLYDPRLLLDWAERRYPGWFPGPEADRVAPPYLYRFYPSTLNHLGVAGNDVAVLGPLSDNQLRQVGALADFECDVLPARCPAGGPTLAERRAAAAVAATQADCIAAQPFHWSIGDAGGRLAEGRQGDAAPQLDTVMPIASASKWLFAAYVAERRGGQPTPEDIELLNFTSGYTGFDFCLRDQTVAECQAYQGLLVRNGGFTQSHVGRFYYSGGHMQKHAVLMGLGADDNTALARHVGDAIGARISYTQPQLAGGVSMSADEYGRFLQRVTAGRLQIASLLGRHAVCTNPDTCSTAIYSPVSGSMSWHYALGHWVETDPIQGDGSFSSAGAFGFYPWVDSQRTWWGIVARHKSSGLGGDDAEQRPARESAACGLRIRAAWMTGRAG
jgi:hypothetical protein